MAITAKINVTTGIGRATITQPNKSTIVAQNFAPKPDVSINQIDGITTTGVQDGRQNSLLYLKRDIRTV